MPPSAGQKGQDDRVILVGGDASPGWMTGSGISGRLDPEYPYIPIIGPSEPDPRATLARSHGPTVDPARSFSIRIFVIYFINHIYIEHGIMGALPLPNRLSHPLT
jgi:hypothetical protein